MINVIIIAAAVLIDQLTKYLAVEHIRGQTVSVVPGLFSFEYTTNKGMAWGLLSDRRWIFIALSIIALAFFGYIYFRAKRPHFLFRLSLGLVLGGGAGNMIDRLFRRGGVVDFIKTDFISFPIFNAADSFITVGAVLLGIYLIFIDHKMETPVFLTKKPLAHTDGS